MLEQFTDTQIFLLAWLLLGVGYAVAMAFDGDTSPARKTSEKLPDGSALDASAYRSAGDGGAAVVGVEGATAALAQGR